MLSFDHPTIQKSFQVLVVDSCFNLSLNLNDQQMIVLQWLGFMRKDKLLLVNDSKQYGSIYLDIISFSSTSWSSANSFSVLKNQSEIVSHIYNIYIYIY